MSLSLTGRGHGPARLAPLFSKKPQNTQVSCFLLQWRPIEPSTVWLWQLGMCWDKCVQLWHLPNPSVPIPPAQIRHLSDLCMNQIAVSTGQDVLYTAVFSSPQHNQVMLACSALSSQCHIGSRQTYSLPIEKQMSNKYFSGQWYPL